MLGDDDDSDDEVASVADVTSRVCDSVKEATKFPFPENEVIHVSGLWGGMANQLQCATSNKKDKENAVQELSKWPHLKGGEGESVKASLLNLSSEDVAKHLKEASGIHILEQR